MSRYVLHAGGADGQDASLQRWEAGAAVADAVFTAHRVLDVCLLTSSRHPKRIATEPPMLCIEVLSPEDRSSRTRVKCEDYLRMGVPEVWVSDPEQRKAHVLTPDGAMPEHRGGPLRLSGTEIAVDLDEIFQALDPQV